MSTTADNTIIGLLTTISASGGGGGGGGGATAWGAITGTLSNQTDLNNALAGKAGSLTPTAVKTSAYNAVVGDFIPVDTTSGSVTVTLPTAPADMSRIGIKQVIRGGTNTVTYACGGSDVLNRAGGSTSGTLTLSSSAVTLQYKAMGAIWYIIADDLPYGSLLANANTWGGVQTLTGPVLGTPASGTLTACTGLPVSTGISGLGTGVATALAANANATGGFDTINGTATLTNKRITKRLGTEASNATPSINSDNVDVHTITAQAAALTSLTITGTPTEGQSLLLQIKDDGTNRALTFGTGSCAFSTDLAAPTTTTTGKWGEYSFIYRVALTKWLMCGKLENIS